MKRKGIDVSTYQGYPNWARVAADGVEFVMIKASQGRAESSESYLFRDSKFVYNIKNAAAAGIRCGVYHYFTAQNAAECDREAEFFLAQIEPYRNNITLYAAVDVESKYLRELSKEELSTLVIRFCNTVRAAGYKPVVYTNPDWLRNRLSGIGENDLWLALWRGKEKVPTGYERLRIWQWGAFSVDGISGKVDANIGYFDSPPSCEKPDEPELEINVSTPSEPSRRKELRVGDEVRIENPVLYGTNRKFLTKFRTYTVQKIVGDRVSVAHCGQWCVDVHIDHIEQVCDS